MSAQAKDIIFLLSGGTGNADPNFSLGGSPSDTIIISNNINNLFDNVSSSDPTLVDYRAFYITNDGSENVENLRVWIDSERSGGSTIKIGMETRDETQQVVITGDITGGDISFQVDGNIFNVLFDPNIGIWATNFQNSINVYFPDTIVNGSQSGNTYIFNLYFQGRDSRRNTGLITVYLNNLTGTITNITTESLQDGAPINSVTAFTGNVKTAPNVAFSYPNQNNPFVIPDLRPNDFFAIWVQRTTETGVDPINNDGFKLAVGTETPTSPPVSPPVSPPNVCLVAELFEITPNISPPSPPVNTFKIIPDTGDGKGSFIELIGTASFYEFLDPLLGITKNNNGYTFTQVDADPALSTIVSFGRGTANYNLVDAIRNGRDRFRGGNVPTNLIKGLSSQLTGDLIVNYDGLNISINSNNVDALPSGQYHPNQSLQDSPESADIGFTHFHLLYETYALNGPDVELSFPYPLYAPGTATPDNSVFLIQNLQSQRHLFIFILGAIRNINLSLNLPSVPLTTVSPTKKTFSASSMTQNVFYNMDILTLPGYYLDYCTFIQTAPPLGPLQYPSYVHNCSSTLVPGGTLPYNADKNFNVNVNNVPSGFNFGFSPVFGSLGYGFGPYGNPGLTNLMGAFIPSSIEQIGSGPQFRITLQIIFWIRQQYGEFTYYPSIHSSFIDPNGKDFFFTGQIVAEGIP